MATSFDKISLRLPESWRDLSDKQLYYVYSLFSESLSAEQVKAYCFFRWSGLRIIGRYADCWEVALGKMSGLVKPQLVSAGMQCLSFLEEVPQVPVRISRIDGHMAAAADLADDEPVNIDFEKFLYCDNLYTGYLQTRDHSLLSLMAQVLYDCEKIRLCQAEKISIFYWWASLKSMMSKSFQNFLQPVSPESVLEGGAALAARMQKAMEAQIRALTGGDVTKRRQVLALNPWVALGELDAKAREYNEFKARNGNK